MHVVREIARQPDAWERAIAESSAVASRLPAAGERVAVLGCGTSWFMAAAYAVQRELSGTGETDFFAASQMPTARAYDRVVAITRSGTTTEVVRALERTTSPTVAITAIPGSPAGAVADAEIVLDYADEQSVVQTLFATTTLILLRASLGEGLDEVVAQARRVLRGEHDLPAEMGLVEQVTFLGQGRAYGIAQEAALKLREATQLWAEAYPQMEYRHGPLAIAEPGRAVWVFGPPEPGIAADVRATGALLVSSELDPLADLVRAQIFAVRRARTAGLDPDRPRGLSRSVVLPL